jgi:tetratricopeptide (TPR) repeat protein
MKRLTLFSILSFVMGSITMYSQGLVIPNTNTNYKCEAGRTIGTTDIAVKWNAPGVKGREGKIFGTPIAPYGMNVLGFGSDTESPWRAGADECTTISFSTDVTVNGQPLKAGKYAFFIELAEDHCALVFNKNVNAWGSYFYDPSMDVMRVAATQQTDIATSKERMEYIFSNQTPNSIEIAMEWEHWRIPFTVEMDVNSYTLASIKDQLTGGIGFNSQSLTAAARWCLTNDVNHEQALKWITRAENPNLGGSATFNTMNTKAGLLRKMGKMEEANIEMKKAVEVGTAFELHGYGRQLLAQKKVDEAINVFQVNYDRNKGAWPTNVGLMRGYSAKGDLKKALQYAKVAYENAPDALNKSNLEAAIKSFESGKAI